MKTYVRFCSIAVVMALLVISCGPRVDTEKRTTQDLSSFSSYSFLPNQDTIQTSSYDNAMVNEVVIDEINTNLQAQDLRLDRNQPDLLVYYHLMLDEEVAVNATPVYNNYRYYSPGYYVGPYYRNYAYNNYFTVPRVTGTVQQVPYKEGTLVVDLINRRTNEIVWRGRADDMIDPENLKEELRSYIAAIFEEYPG